MFEDPVPRLILKPSVPAMSVPHVCVPMAQRHLTVFIRQLKADTNGRVLVKLREKIGSKVVLPWVAGASL